MNPSVVENPFFFPQLLAAQILFAFWSFGSASATYTSCNLVFTLWGGLWQGGDDVSSGEAYSDGEGSSGGSRGDYSSGSESESDKRDINVDFFEEDRSEPRKIDVAAPLYKNPYFQKHGFPPRYKVISQAWFQLLVAINGPTWWILLPSFIFLVISRNLK